MPSARSLAFLVALALFVPAPGAAQSDAGMGYAAAKVELADERVTWLRAMLQQVKNMHAVGDATETDVAQVEARLARARAELARYQGQLREAEARYESVIGEPPPGAPDSTPDESE